ncbi:MAG: hypothetical protein NTY06_02585, partial [Candidatus Gottesmanbacteria bacterium]|nr:hypothetical protein [Candidatus Gottesmanbacteria bacterium]
GSGAYPTNGPPITGSSCANKLHVMGFSAERGIGEVLENFGHRVEGTMVHIYGVWNSYTPTTDWEKFAATDHYIPGKAACGGVHYAPNSERDYDWSNSQYANSTCDDWLNYPNLTGATKLINCSTWSCNEYDGYTYKKWWFMHLPHAAGQTDGKWNNWWRYVVNSD